MGYSCQQTGDTGDGKYQAKKLSPAVAYLQLEILSRKTPIYQETHKQSTSWSLSPAGGKMTPLPPTALTLSSLLLLPSQYSASSLLLVAGGHSNDSLAVEVNVFPSHRQADRKSDVKKRFGRRCCHLVAPCLPSPRRGGEPPSTLCSATGSNFQYRTTIS